VFLDCVFVDFLIVYLSTAKSGRSSGTARKNAATIVFQADDCGGSNQAFNSSFISHKNITAFEI
jgi:hypothetical protein